MMTFHISEFHIFEFQMLSINWSEWADESLIFSNNLGKNGALSGAKYLIAGFN